MMFDYYTMLLRDLRVARSSGGNWALGLVFFALFVLLSAFALGPDNENRAEMAIALVWLAAALTSQLSLDRLFAADMDDETLDSWFAANRSIFSLVLAKFTGHWLISFVPVMILSPFGALMLGAKHEALPALMLSLFAGGPALIFAGGMAAALAARFRGSGLLLVLLSGPLMAAPIIFGIGAATTGSLFSADMSILCAVSLAAIAICPPVSALALKVHME